MLLAPNCERALSKSEVNAFKPYIASPMKEIPNLNGQKK